MKVYLQGPRTGTYTLHACPGGHEPGECPADWFDADVKPLTFHVVFINGEAKVDNRLGRYLLKHGMAFKTSLIMPPGLIAA